MRGMRVSTPSLENILWTVALQGRLALLDVLCWHGIAYEYRVLGCLYIYCRTSICVCPSK